MLSQFISLSSPSSPSWEYLVCNIKNLNTQLSISYLKQRQQHYGIIAFSRPLHWPFFIQPFKSSHLFLPVNTLHNSLSPAIQSIRLSSICPGNDAVSHTLSFPPHLWNSTSRVHNQLFFKFFFRDSFYPSENQRRLFSFICTQTLFNFILLYYSLITEWPCYFTVVISSFLSQNLPTASFPLFTL